MAKAVVRLGVRGETVHDFRSVFRDWAGNETSYPRESAEPTLSHCCWRQGRTGLPEAYPAVRRAGKAAGSLMGSWEAWCEARATDGHGPAEVEKTREFNVN